MVTSPAIYVPRATIVTWIRAQGRTTAIEPTELDAGWWTIETHRDAPLIRESTSDEIADAHRVAQGWTPPQRWYG